jgi:hypothetical protein
MSEKYVRPFRAQTSTAHGSGEFRLSLESLFIFIREDLIPVVLHTHDDPATFGRFLQAPLKVAYS